MAHKIDFIVGIRPDFIRMKQVLKEAFTRPELQCRVIHTGQHYDKNLMSVFFDELELPEPDIMLSATGSSHGEQHAKLIAQLEDVLVKDRPDYTCFLGDANAVIGSIAPFKINIPVIHIEAGMRSYDLRMPEEKNRTIIDRISSILYCYHQNYKDNLILEGIDPYKISVVGNTIVDVLAEEFPSVLDDDEIHMNRFGLVDSTCFRYGVRPDNYAIMTLHRDENMNAERARSLIFAVSDACKKIGIPCILIQMPRLKAFKIKYPSNILPIDPLGFFDFINLELGASMEFTDSGTNQEVAAIAGIPCVVLRTSTERPETLDTNISVLCANDKNVYNAAKFVMDNIGSYNKLLLGDGQAGKKIVDDMVKRFEDSADDSVDFVNYRIFSRRALF